MAQAAIPLMIAGSLVKTVGGLQAASYNADVLRTQAAEERNLGVAEVEKIRSTARAAMGRQISRQAESGFLPGRIGCDGDRGKPDQPRARYHAVAARERGRARGLDMQAKQVKRTAAFEAVGNLIGAAQTIAGYKSDYASAGQAGGYSVGG